jgi:ATP-dependent Lon protease
LSLIPVLAIRDAVHFPGLINTLLVVREPSVLALRKATQGDQRVVVLSQRDMSVEDPSTSDLFTVGILSETVQTIPLPDTSLRVALRGIYRVRAKKIVARGGCFFAEVEELLEVPTSGEEAEALARTAVASFTRVVERNDQIPPESLEGVVHAANAGQLADTILHHLPIKSEEKQVMMEELDHRSRLEATVKVLHREEQILDLRGLIHDRVERELGDTQREYYLREQLRVIQAELQEREDRLGEGDDYRQKIARAEMPAEAEERALAELSRLERSTAASPEAMVIRNYLDILVALPWSRRTEDRLDIGEAKRLLDDRHLGLEDVKDRILDFLAVRRLRGDSLGSILCFVGPPGVGKTSIGRSIADAMGRRFFRVALGGVRDEGEIRGHRKTYVGSMPGRIMQGLRECGSRNPVVVLDEIDKLGQGQGGDPMSALLEALDPEQNRRFSDHYVEVPFDLGDVIFIATGNLQENVPGPLRDRMEIIPFRGYTEEERLEIARRFLLTEAKSESGLSEDQLTIDDDALLAVVREHTREAGVRDLRRKLLRLARKAARRVAEGTATSVHLKTSDLSEILGHPKWSNSEKWTDETAGVAWGLVVSELGGGIVPVEAVLLEPAGAHPDVRLTGNLGEVMKESALAAVTFLQSHLKQSLKKDVHIHVPEGAVPKDGPSAGITILLSLASAYWQKAVRTGLAATGEISLSGRILPVGGVRDKLIAAAAAGITDVLLPAENAPDLEDLPASAKEKLRIHLIRHASEALDLAFGSES